MILHTHGKIDQISILPAATIIRYLNQLMCAKATVNF